MKQLCWSALLKGTSVIIRHWTALFCLYNTMELGSSELDCLAMTRHTFRRFGMNVFLWLPSGKDQRIMSIAIGNKVSYLFQLVCKLLAARSYRFQQVDQLFNTNQNSGRSVSNWTENSWITCKASLIAMDLIWQTKGNHYTHNIENMYTVYGVRPRIKRNVLSVPACFLLKRPLLFVLPFFLFF